MYADHLFRVLDVHAGGAPSRIVQSGVPHVEGPSMMAKMQAFAAEHDWIRKALVLEPRGKEMTSAVVLTEPVHPDAHVGAFFMEAHGYLPMCGSDTIATVTALVETGEIPATGPETIVRIDTPAGLIEGTAHVEPSGRVSAVTFVNAPGFCAVNQQPVDVPGIGEVTVDVSYGGNFYVITDARKLGLEFDPTRTRPLVAAAHAVREATNATFDSVHPTFPQINGVTHVQLFFPPERAGDPTLIVVVMPTGGVDRSPCGTGTTAKVATLFARGELGIGESFTHQSLTGARFIGRPLEATSVGSTPACRVSITGTAYLVAESTIFVDRSDVMAEGFLLA